MKSKRLNHTVPKIFALVYNTGDEVIQQMTQFAEENNLRACHFTGIGAFSEATIAFFDFSINDYRKIEVNEQVEVLILSGNISFYENKPKIHTHVVLGKSDGSTVGGHLLSARIKPTLEVFITEFPIDLNRTKDEQTGLPLLEL